MTVQDVLKASSAEAHGALARQWAETVWRAWQPHHEEVRAWAALG